MPLIPQVSYDVKEARALYEVVKSQDKGGAAGIDQAERALGRLEHEGESVDGPSHPYDDPRSFVRPYLPDDHPETSD